MKLSENYNETCSAFAKSGIVDDRF